MIHFQCEHCGTKLRIPEAQAGRKGRCPKCKGSITVPQANATPAKSLDDAMFDLPLAPVPSTPQPAPAPDDDTTDPEEERTQSVFDILLYPINVSGVVHLLIFSLLPPLWKQAMTLQFWESPGIAPLFWLVLLTLYFVHYMAMCISHSAGGGFRAPDINSDSAPLSVDALLSTGKTVLPAVALVWGPPLAYHVIGARTDWLFAAWLAGAGFLFPMIVLAVNDFDAFRAASPLLVLPSIAGVFGPYCLLVACLFVLTGLAGLLMYLSVGPAGMWFLRPLVFYVVLVEMHLLGRFSRRYEERLNWGT